MVRSRKYLVCFVLLALVVLMNLPLPVSMRIKATSRDSFAPFQNVMSLVVFKVGEQMSVLRGLGGAAREKRDLQAHVTKLEHRIRQLEGLEQENTELREQLGFARLDKHRLVMCEVVGRGGASGWWQTVMLNTGLDDGIRPNMAVVTKEGLIGKTLEVTRHTCSVLLITDPNSKVSCEFARVGAFGIVSGRGVDVGGDAVLEMLCAIPDVSAAYVPKDRKVVRGDKVVTSGLGGVYPKGLPIGRVIESRVDASRLYQRVAIVPSADMSRLRYVFVVDTEHDEDRDKDRDKDRDVEPVG
ncbi:rod shape-determining protein MreC [Verrucomicrobiota bacterium]